MTRQFDPDAPPSLADAFEALVAIREFALIAGARAMLGTTLETEYLARSLTNREWKMITAALKKAAARKAERIANVVLGLTLRDALALLGSKEPDITPLLEQLESHGFPANPSTLKGLLEVLRQKPPRTRTRERGAKYLRDRHEGQFKPTSVRAVVEASMPHRGNYRSHRFSEDDACAAAIEKHHGKLENTLLEKTVLPLVPSRPPISMNYAIVTRLVHASELVPGRPESLRGSRDFVPGTRKSA